MLFRSAPPAGDGRKGGFQPMPANFGLLPELAQRIREKRLRYGAYRDRALADLEAVRGPCVLANEAGGLAGAPAEPCVSGA